MYPSNEAGSKSRQLRMYKLRPGIVDRSPTLSILCQGHVCLHRLRREGETGRQTDRHKHVPSHCFFAFSCQLLRLSLMAGKAPTVINHTTNNDFILSRLDYCNSLLAGLPNDKLQKLQRIQNSAARLVLGRSKYDHATPMLRELHWLPIKARIEYKLALTCFKSKSGNYASDISYLLVPYTPSRSLRSSSSNNFSTPRIHLKGFGERAFTFSGPFVWNALPQEIKSCSTLGHFRKQMKTHLFRKYLN